ncbi:MAG: 50S ribosomal protein L5 [Alphaproteobacteria bacterium]|jgi:large subunit ribosomal protein L5|nr:50S ribosomal protein L5 [Alphaproteobacteria bacterium]
MTRLLQHYKDIVMPSLVKKFGYTNPMQIPKLEKITINIGVGEAALDKKKIEAPFDELALISGQKPIICLSKQAIAGFKLRENMPIGTKVTLRKSRMYEFMDRFVNVALPRVRDFRGLNNKGFDGNGNYSMGLKEQLIFPEVDYNKVDKVRGMNITFCTTAKTDEEAQFLLKEFYMPFNKMN